MGTQKRSEVVASNSTVPGPGNYSFKSSIGEGPKIGLRSRHCPLKSSTTVPGPGSYQPKHDTVIDKSPSSGIGYGNRASLYRKEKILVPGPGAYPIKDKSIEGPKYGFGTEKRANIKLSLNPGPGNYSIPATFAALPSYEHSKSKSGA